LENDTQPALLDFGLDHSLSLLNTVARIKLICDPLDEKNYKAQECGD